MGVRKKRIMMERMKNNTEFVSLPGKILFSSSSEVIVVHINKKRKEKKKREERVNQDVCLKG